MPAALPTPPADPEAVPATAPAALTVAVVDPGRARVAVLEEGLHGAGAGRVVVVPDAVDLLERLRAVEPDVVVIAPKSPSGDLLERMFSVSRLVERPVAMFVDRTDDATTRAAIDAGVSAYVVDGLRRERIRPILDVAILRFDALARLRRELAEARNELAERKVVERAKGIVMRVRGVGEEEAYALLRRQAMNEKRKLAEIARSVVTAAELLG